MLPACPVTRPTAPAKRRPNTLRGFKDDQYNAITFDGIPWGDTSNPAHHSTSFTAAVIGGASSKRGQQGQRHGNCHFWRNINCFSKKPSLIQCSAFQLFAAPGTPGLFGVAFEVAARRNSDALFSYYTSRKVDGYLSQPHQEQQPVTEIEEPVGDSSMLTFSRRSSRLCPADSKGEPR
jgi:iron complex outermembrane receptor protein